MIEVNPAFTDEAITREEWAWVRDLIHDVEQERAREEFVKQLCQWDLVVRRFRKLEIKRIVAGNPTAEDRQYQASCLHGLLALGQALRAEACRWPEEKLALLGFRHAELDAYVAELEQSARELNHGLSDGELAAAGERIFGATTAIHR